MSSPRKRGPSKREPSRCAPTSPETSRNTGSPLSRGRQPRGRDDSGEGGDDAERPEPTKLRLHFVTYAWLASATLGLVCSARMRSVSEALPSPPVVAAPLPPAPLPAAARALSARIASIGLPGPSI